MKGTWTPATQMASSCAHRAFAIWPFNSKKGAHKKLPNEIFVQPSIAFNSIVSLSSIVQSSLSSTSFFAQVTRVARLINRASRIVVLVHLHWIWYSSISQSPDHKFRFLLIFKPLLSNSRKLGYNSTTRYSGVMRTCVPYFNVIHSTEKN